MENKNKRWFISCTILILTAVLLLGAVTVVIDPYFHYHKPVSFVRYKLDNERYQNDGILRHFDYNAIITGTSMTQCFKPSELDGLFGMTTVKVPYSGGSFKEVNNSLKRAFQYNSDIKMVVRTVDMDFYYQDKDTLSYEGLPTYLYDNNILNDVSYVFNKDVLLSCIQQFRGYLASKDNSISLDEYTNWSAYFTYGKDAVFERYNRDAVEVVPQMLPVTESEQKNLEATIEQNFLEIAKENSDTEFYYYFPPYSICFYDFWNRTGVLEKTLLAEQYTIKQMLEYDNIHVFAFSGNRELICDLNNYKDFQHHSGEVNSMILRWIKDGEYEITKENYDSYCQESYDFFMNYDYDSIFE